jgi:hypothetical protein
MIIVQIKQITKPPVHITQTVLFVVCFVWYGYTIPRILFGVNGTLRVLCGFVFYAQNQAV